MANKVNNNDNNTHNNM